MSFSTQYGQSAVLFGHEDYAAAKQRGASDAEILAWLSGNQGLLAGKNVPGGGGLYDEIKQRTTQGTLGITAPEFQAAQTAAELQTRSQISNYGWDAQKAMENVRQAAETERLKYEIDNRIPVVQAEAKGKIDLQKIVNAGLENVTRIERGADMMRSITSMFNF